jgi:transposase
MAPRWLTIDDLNAQFDDWRREVAKPRLGGIGRRANHYLRRLLIHGARAVALRLGAKTDDRSRWFQSVIDRRGFNKGLVAQANKTVRAAWAMLTRQEDYRPA